jgi:hypothetical protein
VWLRRSFDEMSSLGFSIVVPSALLTVDILKQPGKAMIHSSRRDRKTKAIAEVLAIIADAHPPLAPLRPCPVLDTEEWLWESATEFCAALDRYAERAMQIKRENP